MFATRTVLGLALALSTATCAGAAEEDGFIELFNGENLEGWSVKGNEAGFQVKDGIIHSKTGAGGNLMYYTEQEFADFELIVEWRVSPKGNSGVFIRADESELQPWSTSFEIQISSEEPARDDSRCTGSLYAYVAVDPRPHERPEEWRTFHIRAEGGNVQVKVDGVEVIDFDMDTLPDTKDKPRSGFIGLQDSHGPAGTWIEYRTVKVRPLLPATK